MSLQRKSVYLFLFLVVLFLGMAKVIDTVAIQTFDTFVTTRVQVYSSKSMTKFMKFLTTIGSYKVEYPIFFLFICIIVYMRKRAIYSIMVIVNLLGVRLLNQLLKHLYERPRPEGEHLVSASGFSFPSGHAMISIAFYGFLAYIIVVLYKHQIEHISIVPLLVGILIFLIGLSRVYLGVHYPSDVIAGFIAGGAWLLVCIRSLQYFRNDVIKDKNVTKNH